MHLLQLQKSEGLAQCDVRLQWDPDHSPVGDNLTRRAIQLGLKNDVCHGEPDCKCSSVRSSLNYHFDYSLLLLVCCHLDQLLGHLSVIDRWTQDA